MNLKTFFVSLLLGSKALAADPTQIQQTINSDRHVRDLEPYRYYNLTPTLAAELGLNYSGLENFIGSEGIEKLLIMIDENAKQMDLSTFEHRHFSEARVDGIG